MPHLAAEWWWPLQINTGGTTSTLYQPQLDSWDGYKLSARIAVRGGRRKGKPQAQFGVLTVDARALPDKGRRTLQIDQAQIAKADFVHLGAAK